MRASLHKRRMLLSRAACLRPVCGTRHQLPAEFVATRRPSSTAPRRRCWYAPSLSRSFWHAHLSEVGRASSMTLPASSATSPTLCAPPQTARRTSLSHRISLLRRAVESLGPNRASTLVFWFKRSPSRFDVVDVRTADSADSFRSARADEDRRFGPGLAPVRSWDVELCLFGCGVARLALPAA